jgi:hypothetical protein
MSVIEMRMLRWICSHTMRDRIKNDDIWGQTWVTPIQEKLVQHYLRWFDHIQLMSPEIPVHSGILCHPEDIRRERGRPRLT